MFVDFDELDAMEREEPIRCSRLFVMSDIHTDAIANMDFIQRLREHPTDACIIAGDVSDKLEVLERTLTSLVAKFRVVFFVPGNHELWLRSSESAQLTDSIHKLRVVLELCDRLGVRTMPTALRVSGMPLWVVPLLSWYHASFDTEPPLDPRWCGVHDISKTLTDYALCRWPEGSTDEDIALLFDSLNSDRWTDASEWTSPAAQQRWEARDPSEAVISFSHFLPRQELVPERRYLYKPELPKAVGSLSLGARVSGLGSAIHVFGHTHFGWDMTLDGIRYISAPLAMPMERKTRLSTVATEQFPDDQVSCESTEPLLLLDHYGFAGPMRAGWSGFYEKYPRDPDEVLLLPDYVAQGLEWMGDGDAPVGWGGKAPAWSFGPTWTQQLAASHT